MVVELNFLRRKDLTTGNALDVANVMMGTNEQRVAWVVQEFTNRRQLTFIGMLNGALRMPPPDRHTAESDADLLRS